MGAHQRPQAQGLHGARPGNAETVQKGRDGMVTRKALEMLSEAALRMGLDTRYLDGNGLGPRVVFEKPAEPGSGWGSTEYTCCNTPREAVAFLSGYSAGKKGA